MLTTGPAPGQATVDPVLTCEQVAEMFRVSPRTVQRWGKAGKLASLRASDVAKLLVPVNVNVNRPQASPDALQPE